MTEQDVPEEDAGEEFGLGSTDYDLSEEHGYTWEPARTQVIPQWLMIAVSILVVIALFAPTVYLVWRFG